MNGFKYIAAFAFILLFTAMACSLPAPDAEPVEQQTTLEPSHSEPSLNEQLATAETELRESGSATIRLSEQQLTEFVAQQMTSVEGMTITETQVSLRDGQMTLLTKIEINLLTVQARIIFAPSVYDGVLQMSVVSAELGSLPLPDSVISEIQTALNQLLNDQFILDGQSVYVDQVEIADGMMTITGRSR